MTDFLWHKVSEKEKEDIKKQAKLIMDDFSRKLSRVKLGDEPLIERPEGEREEGPAGMTSISGGLKECLNIDKKIMFANAPNKNKDFIIGEKKKW